MNTVEKDSAKRLYEVGYLLIPLIPTDKVADEVNVLRSYIENSGGFIASEDQPKMRKLAYEIQQRGIASKRLRFSEAYFGWVRFQVQSSQVAVIEEFFDKNDKVLRFLIIKPGKDTPRFIRSSLVVKPKIEVLKKEKKDVISDQDLDKEIDMLLGQDKVATV